MFFCHRGNCGLPPLQDYHYQRCLRRKLVLSDESSCHNSFGLLRNLFSDFNSSWRWFWITLWRVIDKWKIERKVVSVGLWSFCVRDAILYQNTSLKNHTFPNRGLQEKKKFQKRINVQGCLFGSAEYFKV